MLTNLPRPQFRTIGQPESSSSTGTTARQDVSAKQLHILLNGLSKVNLVITKAKLQDSFAPSPIALYAISKLSLVGFVTVAITVDGPSSHTAIELPGNVQEKFIT